MWWPSFFCRTHCNSGAMTVFLFFCNLHSAVNHWVHTTCALWWQCLHHVLVKVGRISGKNVTWGDIFILVLLMAESRLMCPNRQTSEPFSARAMLSTWQVDDTACAQVHHHSISPRETVSVLPCSWQLFNDCHYGHIWQVSLMSFCVIIVGLIETLNKWWSASFSLKPPIT